MVTSCMFSVISGLMGFFVVGSYVPCPTLKVGGFFGFTTRRIGASFPSRVASFPSEGRNVLNRPVLSRATESLLSERQSAPDWCAWYIARLRNGEETPTPTW